ncbi:MAG: orotate phosphoribosyltransferase [Candidatus Margulisbacteria bacterium]|nr:orotate phosphoribosyltransferase [Candidatus Margulisiibacteriota bacterium]
MKKEELGQKIVEAALLEGDFTLRSGKKSKYYFDKYLFGTKPEILSPLAVEIAKYLPPLNTFKRIAAPELGAITLATAVALEVNKPIVIVRKAQKDYGTAKVFEGELIKGEKVVLIEDILTTAGAALKAAENLKNFGVEVLKIIGVIDREEGARENIKKAGFEMDAVFTKTSLGIKQ